MVTCTRLIQCDVAHRVLKHESKCKHVHGHRMVFEITAHAESLDSVGRIIDFSVLKEKVGGWVDDNWDHNIILFKDDVQAIEAINSIEGNRAPFISTWNPTAENIADYLLKVVCPMVLEGTGVKVVKVVSWETPNGKAEATL